MAAAITIKGTRDGLLITLESGELPELLNEIRTLFEGRNTFFRGGKVAVQAGDRRLSLAEITRLKQTLERYDLSVWAIFSTDPDSRAAPKSSASSPHWWKLQRICQRCLSWANRSSQAPGS